jgi:hypothetical protein
MRVILAVCMVPESKGVKIIEQTVAWRKVLPDRQRGTAIRAHALHAIVKV